MSDHVRGWTAIVGLRKPEWQCTDCWYRDQPCDHPDLARKQTRRSRCRVGCPCTFTNDCPHCAVGGFHQCKAVTTARVVSEFTCWTCVRGLHMGTDGTNCVCCGKPFIGPMLGQFHDEPVPDPWGTGTSGTDDSRGTRDDHLAREGRAAETGNAGVGTNATRRPDPRRMGRTH